MEMTSRRAPSDLSAYDAAHGAVHAAALAAARLRALSVRADPAQVTRQRADRRTRGLTALLARRPELRGVHAPADGLDDAVRWSA